ncbi:glycosyltransferase family 2 protein [Sinanaerobacter chloroacetimidivorans]|jgi:cellulose synthase/poly-beta-1,6-N-acetylglucosamine synthase-like glycosyltransferase|uniref:Glycosyltransferase n=1 Tax=Sinanaerobacter chloroacetimidivorans TaxID=2818044 RepID=A0A8J7W663_9FIRM|nr:glycosyltransferase family 2 protein [Sinanaerobacter chloroacetimidivorans]MBR0599645.1 glycosyltransferase [Sinanaerobacter chloroacetimidivorans]
MELLEFAVDFFIVITMFIFIYNIVYSLLTLLFILASAFSLSDFVMNRVHMRSLNLNDQSSHIPISILVPAYNEKLTIVSSIESLLCLDYPGYEIVVVNDGSTDGMEELIIEHFGLHQVFRPIRRSIQTKPCRSIFETKIGRTRLTLVNKENGGKADALNTGINVSNYPLFVAMDADSMLQANALKRIVYHFVKSEKTIVVGGNIKVGNNCILKNGIISRIAPTKNPLIIFQTIEYLRVFLSSRVALNLFNLNIIISGAFGLFKKKAVIEVGGYDVATIGEDMELIMKLHEYNISRGNEYIIHYAPDAMCYTQSPEDLKSLKSQRMRWHIGLMDSLFKYKHIIFNTKYKMFGFMPVSYYAIFELGAPIVDIFGFILIPIAYFTGYVSIDVFLFYFLCFSIYNISISFVSICFEAYLFKAPFTKAMVVQLVLFSILECLGYRQICSYFRILGMIRFNKARNTWGKIHRVKTEYHDSYL